MKARSRSVFLVFVCLFVLGGLCVPPRAQAQEPVGEGQAPLSASPVPEAPTVDSYLWMAGSAFQPRNSSVSYDYVGNGCITSNTGGSALNQSFTASFRVPSGSIIYGVRFYYDDTSSQDSTLTITSYDGAGNYTDHVFAHSSGAAGAGNVYAALSTPYTVDTSTRGFVFNWYPNVAGSTMQLCGARLYYNGPVAAAPAASPAAPDGPPAPAASAAPAAPIGNSDDPQALPPGSAGAPPPASVDRAWPDDVKTPASPSAADYHFLAGSSFNRRDSETRYTYGQSGCIYATQGTGNRFTIDLNIPDGARVYGARFYYYDTDPARALFFWLTDYTGLGQTRDLLSGASNTNTGFGSLYVAMPATYDPYYVAQESHSLNAIVGDADSSSLQLCGVRVFYETPAAVAPLRAGEEPVPAGGAPAAPLDAAAPLLVSDLLPKAFAQDLQLPQGASARGLRVYYANSQAPDGFVQIWNYTGTTATFLGSTTTAARSGFNSTYADFATPYVVDHYSANLGVVPFLVYNRTYKFCGVRVFYYQGTTSRYRFIAGSAFHPRNSSTQFSYENTGCIAISMSSLFLPLLRR